MVLQFFEKHFHFPENLNESYYANLSYGRLLWKSLVLFFRRLYALSVGFEMKTLKKVFSNVKTKTNSNFAVKVTERSRQSHFSDIPMIMEFKELNCVNIWKMSEAVNLALQWIFVLNSVKHKSFPVSIVK